MMIRNPQLRSKCKIVEWKSDGERDECVRDHIWRQLFGETERGDDLEFAMVQMKENGSEKTLYCGLLKDTAGKLKALIPGIFEKIENGTLYFAEYSGRTVEAHIDELNPMDREAHIEVDMDAFGKLFTM